MAFAEQIVVGFVVEQRREGGRPIPGIAPHAGAFGQRAQRDGLHVGHARRAGQIHKAQGRAERDHILGVRERHHLFGRELERGDEAFAEFGQEVQRPAEEGDLAPDGIPAGQPADGLFDHGLKDGGGEVFPCGPLVEQRDHVGLGEYPAAGSDGVQGRVVLGKLVQPGGVGVEQRRHLIDERPGAARAGFVHAQIHALAEVEDLGVFAAEFHGHIGLRGKHGDGPGGGHDFLHERQPEGFREPKGRGAGDRRRNRHAGILEGQLVEHGGKRLPDGRSMTQVLRLEQFAVRGDEREFGRG